MNTQVHKSDYEQNTLLNVDLRSQIENIFE